MTRRPLRIPSLPIGLALFVLFLAAPQLSAQTITSLNPPSVAAGGPAFTLTVNGANFAANALVQVNGVSRATVFLSANQLQTTILASDIATPGALAITVFLPAGPVSNTVNLLVTALPPPALTSVAPGISAQGAAGLRLTLIGSNFRAGATVVISPPLPSLLQSNAATQAGDISIDSVSVLNSNIIVAVVSVSPGALLGLRAVDVRNLDGTSTIATPGFNVGTTQPLQVVAGNSLGAPLSITTLSILHPRNGTLVMQGDDLFGEATLAGTGSGSVVGAWLWDGNITEQFAAVFAGGQSVTIRSRHPFPTSFLGSHTVELRILQPNQLLSRPVTVVVNPGTWQLQRLLSPPYGAGIKMNLLPRLRWTPVPGAAKYQVGFSARPYLSTITEWHDATDNEWVVPQNVWEHLPQGDLYWSVRTVEMSGETRKPVPMRLLRRFPENALAATAERPRLTSAGNPLLEWEGLQGHYVYRITISSDPQGSKPLRRYLTADPRVDLRALSGKWDPAKTYYWRVDAVTPEGRTILTGPTHMFEPPAPPASRSSRAEQPGVPGFVLAAYRTGGPERDFSRPAEPLPADLGPQIVNRTPAADSTLSDPKGLLKIEFKTAVNAFDLALMVDDTDVTSMAQVSEATVSYTPAIPLSDGEHKVNVTLGPDTASWKFTVKAGAQVAAENMGTSTGGTPVQSGTDAEAPPAQTPAEIKAAATAAQQGEAQQGPTMEMQSQLSANTNWVSGSAADMNALTFGQQLIFRENGWTVQMNGSGLLNSTLAPDAMRTSLGRVGDYVMQTGLQRGNWGFNLRFGIVAPALYLNSQFITTAVPRQGVETQLKTPGGTFGFYANTNDLAPGGGSGLAFHQQILGASWDLPLPKQRVELRLMWLGSQESGESSMSSALTAGGGDLYGALLQVHLSQELAVEFGIRLGLQHPGPRGLPAAHFRTRLALRHRRLARPGHAQLRIFRRRREFLLAGQSHAERHEQSGAPRHHLHGGAAYRRGHLLPELLLSGKQRGLRVLSGHPHERPDGELVTRLGAENHADPGRARNPDDDRKCSRGGAAPAAGPAGGAGSGSTRPGQQLDRGPPGGPLDAEPGRGARLVPQQPDDRRRYHHLFRAHGRQPERRQLLPAQHQLQRQLDLRGKEHHRRYAHAQRLLAAGLPLAENAPAGAARHFLQPDAHRAAHRHPHQQPDHHAVRRAHLLDHAGRPEIQHPLLPGQHHPEQGRHQQHQHQG